MLPQLHVIRFTVSGQPIPWQRAGVRARGGRSNFYTPEPTRKYQTAVRAAAQAAGMDPHNPFLGPVRLEVRAFNQDRRNRDIDNLAKTVQDALNRFAYADDGQIVELLVTKAIDRDLPRVEVLVAKLGGPTP